MLLSAFLFGVSVVVGKFVIVESNPVFFAWFYCAVMSAGLLPIVGLPLNVPMGMLFSLGMISYTLALERTLTSYVASLERLAIVLDVIYGRIFFREEISRNFWGALLMVLGAVLLAF